MKFESIALIMLTICVFLSFYFAFLSFQEIDEAIQKRLVSFAVYSLITGIMILTCMTVYMGIKKAFEK